MFCLSELRYSSQAADTASQILRCILEQLQNRLNPPTPAPQLTLTDSDVWEEEMAWRKLTTLVHYVAWAWDERSIRDQEIASQQGAELTAQKKVEEERVLSKLEKVKIPPNK